MSTRRTRVVPDALTNTQIDKLVSIADRITNSNQVCHHTLDRLLEIRAPESEYEFREHLEMDGQWCTWFTAASDSPITFGEENSLRFDR